MSDPVTRKTFATDGQYNKYLKVKSFFEELLDLKKQGFFFMIDDELYKTPFIEGWKMGFVEDNVKLLFTGATHALNKETGEYDVPWIDITLKELRSTITPLKVAKFK